MKQLFFLLSLIINETVFSSNVCGFIRVSSLLRIPFAFFHAFLIYRGLVMKYFPSSFCKYGCILKAMAFAVGNDTELRSGKVRVECGNLHCAIYTVQQYS